MLKADYSDIQKIEADLLDFRILFAYHSNKIENSEITYNDTREVFENGKVTSFNGDPRTLFEIQNQKNCYHFLLEKIASKQMLDLSLIKHIHKLLTEGTYDETRYAKGERPGEFKKGDYIVGASEIGSEAENVENELIDLLDEINEADSEDLLTVVSYFHLRFETIHPFADGNGRVGRTLLNYYLMIHGIRPLIIYEEDKMRYYDCLHRYDQNEDIEPMKRFIEYSQKKTWSKKHHTHTKTLISFL